MTHCRPLGEARANLLAACVLDPGVIGQTQPPSPSLSPPLPPPCTLSSLLPPSIHTLNEGCNAENALAFNNQEAFSSQQLLSFEGCLLIFYTDVVLRFTYSLILRYSILLKRNLQIA